MKLNLSILLILIAILTNAQDVQEIYLKTKYKKAIFKGFAKYKRTTTTYNDSTVTVLKNLTKNNLVNKKVEYSKDNRVIESEYFYNGNLRIRTHFKNDRIEKKENYFYLVGGLNYITNYKFGKKNGIESEYYKTGEKRRETTFKNDKKDGACLDYYKTGEPRLKFNYKDGVKNGTILKLGKNGQTIDSSFVKKGVKDGKHITYYPTGEVKKTRTYNNGKIIGKEFHYHKNGTLKKEINYKNFKKDGKVLIFDENGQIKDSVTYNNGDYEGNVNYWYETGELKSSRTYKDGKTNGYFIVYHKNGNVKRREKYENGKFISGKCFTTTNKDTTFHDYMIKPEYPGGLEKMFEYLAKNVKYPLFAKDKGINGKVYVKFIVEKDGEITEVEVIRGIGGGCDDEARRAVQNMPNWDSGYQDNQPVRVRFNLPVNFTLR